MNFIQHYINYIMRPSALSARVVMPMMVQVMLPVQCTPDHGLENTALVYSW